MVDLGSLGCQLNVSNELFRIHSRFLWLCNVDGESSIFDLMKTAFKQLDFTPLNSEIEG